MTDDNNEMKLAEMKPEDRLALVSSDTPESSRVNTVDSLTLARLSTRPRTPDEAGVHIRIYPDSNYVEIPQAARTPAADAKGAFVQAMLLIDTLKSAGRKPANAAVREFSEKDFAQLVWSLSETVQNLGTLAVKRCGPLGTQRTGNEWRAPKMSWELVGLAPGPDPKNAGEAFRKLCAAIAALESLGSVSEAAPELKFDKTAYRVGLSVISAAAQELAQFAMPWVKFDDSAKTMLGQAQDVRIAREEMILENGSPR